VLEDEGVDTRRRSQKQAQEATEVTNELGPSQDTFRWSGVRVCLLPEGTGNEHHECTVEVVEQEFNWWGTVSINFPAALCISATESMLIMKTSPPSPCQI
jgi:hypothetical protein